MSSITLRLKVLGEVLSQPIDGIIGFTFFARYKTTIDYQVNTMSFEPVGFQIRDLLRELPERLAGPKTARRRVLAPGGSGAFVLASPPVASNRLAYRWPKFMPARPRQPPVSNQVTY